MTTRTRTVWPLALGALLLGCSESGLRVVDRGPPAEQEPDIVVEPLELDFGHLDAGCPGADLEITVTNVGNGPLRVTGTSWEGPAGISASDLSGEVPAGGSTTVTITYDPFEPGLSEADVAVLSNDPDSPSVSVSVRGEAVPAGEIGDTFNQNGGGKVDVLFVVDTSESMIAHQDRVAEDISFFFGWFEDLQLDYQIGVITADVDCQDEAGRIQGPLITPQTPEPQAALAGALALGATSCGSPSGLAATQLALSEPLLSADNAGFLREDALLSVVILSDKFEYSDLPPGAYIGTLGTVKPDAGLVSVSAIVGDRSSGCEAVCGSGAVAAEPGDKYLDVQESFIGVFGSICDCDLADTLTDVGWVSAGFKTNFRLSQLAASPDLIEVVVNGTPTQGWTFDEPTNSVVFEAATAPPAYAEITVNYIIAQACFE